MANYDLMIKAQGRLTYNNTLLLYQLHWIQASKSSKAIRLQTGHAIKLTDRQLRIIFYQKVTHLEIHSGTIISSFSFYKNFLQKIIILIDKPFNSFNRRLTKKMSTKNKALVYSSNLLSWHISRKFILSCYACSVGKWLVPN